MITILTSFKPFAGADAVHQVNALASWRALGENVEIIAFGLSAGLVHHATRFGVRIVDQIGSHASGLPRIDEVLRYAQRSANHDLQAYVNGDILLFPDFVAALRAIQLPRFIMVGQRIDVNLDEVADFQQPEAASRARLQMLLSGTLHGVGGMDYFAYRRGSVPELPPLYLGAAAWDNHFVYCARQQRIPVIDATGDVHVFHQNHTYRLTDGFMPEAYQGPAARSNFSVAADPMTRFYTTDASHWLQSGTLKSALISPRHSWRLVLTYPTLRGWPSACWWPFRVVASIIRRSCAIWLRRRYLRGNQPVWP